MYDRMKQECQLFSEHIQYGADRLYEENNDHLITICLDKNSLDDLHQIRKTTENKKSRSTVVSSVAYRKHHDEICHNCEL